MLTPPGQPPAPGQGQRQPPEPPVYTVLVAPAAARAIGKLTAQVQAQLDPVIDALATNPRPDGCRKLAGAGNFYRVRSGDYRVIYTVQDDVLRVLVLKAGHRRDVYR